MNALASGSYSSQNNHQKRFEIACGTATEAQQHACPSIDVGPGQVWIRSHAPTYVMAVGLR